MANSLAGAMEVLDRLRLTHARPAYRKIHHEQTGVGHDGVFSGKSNQQIYPQGWEMIHSSQG